MNAFRNYLLAIIVLICCSCSNTQPKYIIGVSQCSEDIWRNWQNSEMELESNLHEGVELRFATAHNDSEIQIQQIDSLVDSGIDLLIVAPNQLSNVNPAINRAYDSGIPVIIFERKTDSQKYTAFMSADNYEMGHTMGEYVAMRLNGKGHIIEILGLKGSSPAEERHRGFADALRDTEIKILATLQGDWTEEKGYEAIKQYEGNLKDIDLVFAHNDRSALGARRAFIEAKINPLPLFCGIDGLPGKGGGIEMVRDEILDASYIYPTRGDQLLQLALDILDGKPYKRETMQTSALVTSDNANVLILESEEVVRQSQRINRLQEITSNYIQKLSSQRVISIMAVVLIFLLLVLIVGIYYHFLQRYRLNEERTKMEREQLDFYTQVSHELRTPLTLIQGPLELINETREAKEASPETKDLYRILRRNSLKLTDIINKMLDVQAKGHKGLELIDDSSMTPSPEHAPIVAPIVEEDETGAIHPDTILIVDDNADIRAYLRTILQNKYQLNEAADGQQGLALANEIVPDLIVSDVMMPVMNGLEFCQRIKSGTATSHIPVVLLTARAMSHHLIEGYESGADAYITKPFSAELLLARISNLLKSRHQLKNLFGTGAQAPSLSPKEDSFMLSFHKFIEKNMTDSDLNVETIGAELGLSRVQLYRKVKALTGLSPVEVLRKARLKKGKQLLENTNKSISEVAYEVGFSAPSYFTKCFRDEYGFSPSDMPTN